MWGDIDIIKIFALPKITNRKKKILDQYFGFVNFKYLNISKTYQIATCM